MQETFKKTEKIFENYLEYDEIPKIRVFDSKNNTILENIPYNRVFFDADFNVYKIDGKGFLVPVNNPDFKAMIVNREEYKKIP